MSRIEELRQELSNQPDIQIAEPSSVSYRDERKGISYNETVVRVSPKEGVVTDLSILTEGLLPNFQELYRNNESHTLTTFEGSKETGFEVFRIQVSQREKTAQ